MRRFISLPDLFSPAPTNCRVERGVMMRFITLEVPANSVNFIQNAGKRDMQTVALNYRITL